MITEQDLLEAIAECKGERNPNANTCIKLSAFYTILDHLYRDNDSDNEISMSYSLASPHSTDDTVDVVGDYGESEFLQTIAGMQAVKVYEVLDDLMNTIGVINPRLYDGVIRELQSI